MVRARHGNTALSLRLPEVGSRAQLLLKLLAVGLMVADHVHFVFFGRALEWLYWLSRLAFPLFALGVAQNLETRKASPRRYLARLLGYGLLAQPVYLLCFGVPQLNVLFTLAAGVGLWWGLRALELRGVAPLLRWGLALLAAAGLPFLEFGWAGVLAVPVLAALFRRGAWWRWLAWLALAFGVVGFGAPWPMPLLAAALWALASRLELSPRRLPPWATHAFYAFYPAHLAAILVLAWALG